MCKVGLLLLRASLRVVATPGCEYCVQCPGLKEKVKCVAHVRFPRQPLFLIPKGLCSRGGRPASSALQVTEQKASIQSKQLTVNLFLERYKVVPGFVILVRKD
eukprot:1160223-Pelagomonas_calceolata.AAC.13